MPLLVSQTGVVPEQSLFVEQPPAPTQRLGGTEVSQVCGEVQPCEALQTTHLLDAVSQIGVPPAQLELEVQVHMPPATLVSQVAPAAQPSVEVQTTQ